MNSGLRPLPYDHRDYDFIRSKKLAGMIPAFPEFYSTDAGLWMPDQMKECTLFNPPVPPLPYGCTDYTQCDLLADQDKKLYNPLDLENITHANANFGTDLRTSLKAVLKLFGKDHPAYFHIQPDINRGGVLDAFDAARVAMLVGKFENRAVSVGTPWYPTFNDTKRGIIQAPTDYALPGIPWHNWAIKGWKTIDGQAYLIGKPWWGKKGDKGYCYFSREIFNKIMSFDGASMFTLDKLLPGEQPQHIDSTIKQWLVSLFTHLFKVWKR